MTHVLYELWKHAHNQENILVENLSEEIEYYYDKYDRLDIYRNINSFWGKFTDLMEIGAIESFESYHEEAINTILDNIDSEYREALESFTTCKLLIIIAYLSYLEHNNQDS